MYWLLGEKGLNFERQTLTKPHYKLSPKTTPLTGHAQTVPELGFWFRMLGASQGVGIEWLVPSLKVPLLLGSLAVWAKDHFGTADDDEANPNDYGALLVSLSRAYGPEDITGPNCHPNPQTPKMHEPSIASPKI